jgi:putative ABC transport system ATP-binding protein
VSQRSPGVERGDLVAREDVEVMGTHERASTDRVTEAGADELDDRQLAGLRARSIGFVFEQPFLIDGMSVLENVVEGLFYSGTAGGRHVDLP